MLIGYWLASSVFGLNTKPEINQTVKPNQITKQSNFLLIQVSDLESKEPHLLSIWAAFSMESPANDQFYVSLYPTSDANKNAQIASIFTLTRNYSIKPNSLSRLERIFDLDFDGYFVIDNVGFLALASDLGIEQIEISSESPETSDAVIALQSSGTTFYHMLCNLSTSGAIDSFFSQIDWASLIPVHLTSDKSLEEIQKLIDIKNGQSSVENCKVIVPN